MGAIIFSRVAILLALVHAAAAIVLIGASTQHARVAIGYALGRYRVNLGRRYAAVVAASYAATFTLGAMIYPGYRYYVRALFLDRHASWASNLFSMKENFATIGLPLALGAWWLSRSFDPERDREMIVGYVGLVSVQTALVWFNVVIGLLVTLQRGVG